MVWPRFTFLMYVLPRLSRCVDCIIMAVTESHTIIVSGSAES